MVQYLKIWFDREADYLEVTFSDKEGYLRATDHDSVMERVDENGQLLGFTVMNVSSTATDKPLIAELMAEVG